MSSLRGLATSKKHNALKDRQKYVVCFRKEPSRIEFHFANDLAEDNPGLILTETQQCIWVSIKILKLFQINRIQPSSCIQLPHGTIAANKIATATDNGM